MKVKNFLVIISVFLFLAGCISVGSIPKSDTCLTEKNYRVVKTNVRGEDTGFRLLGFISFEEPSHSDAMRNIHEQVNMQGQSMALANVTDDLTLGNFILFSIPRLTISADLIEFTENRISSSETTIAKLNCGVTTG